MYRSPHRARGLGFRRALVSPSGRGQRRITGWEVALDSDRLIYSTRVRLRPKPAGGAGLSVSGARQMLTHNVPALPTAFRPACNAGQVLLFVANTTQVKLFFEGSIGLMRHAPDAVLQHDRAKLADAFRSGWR